MSAVQAVALFSVFHPAFFAVDFRLAKAAGQTEESSLKFRRKCAWKSLELQLQFQLHFGGEGVAADGDRDGDEGAAPAGA